MFDQSMSGLGVRGEGGGGSGGSVVIRAFFFLIPNEINYDCFVYRGFFWGDELNGLRIILNGCTRMILFLTFIYLHLNIF